MKGALLLVKNQTVYNGLIEELKKNGLKFISDESGICIFSGEGDRFVIYNRSEGDNKFDDVDITNEAKNKGYIYSYLIDCRKETLFCDILKKIPKEIDFLILDNNDKLFCAHELDPNIISL